MLHWGRSWWKCWTGRGWRVCVEAYWWRL